MREKVFPPSRDAMTTSVARPSWIQATRIRFGFVGSTATEVSCAYPREKPGLSRAQVDDGEKGLEREMRCVCTFTAAAGADSAATPATASESASTAFA